jgi:hypothetical protein
MMHEMFLNCGAYEIIMMLNELHKRGYQHLRLLSGFSPTGCSWRWMIYPKILMKNEPRLERSNDFMPFECPYGSTGSVRSDVDIIKLADVFEETYRSFCSIGKLPDSEYVEWFNEIVKHAENDDYPIAFADMFFEEQWLFMGSNELLKYPPFCPTDYTSLSDGQIIEYAKYTFDQNSVKELELFLKSNDPKPSVQETADVIRQAIRENKGLVEHYDAYENKEELFAWGEKEKS